MNANSIKYTIVGLTSILLVSLASASELKSDELNCVTIVPDGWTVTFQTPAGFSIASPDRKKTMTLLVRKARFATLDSDSTAGIEQSLLQAGSQKVSSTNFMVDGVSAYEAIHSVGKAPFASSFVTLLTIADGKLYSLQGMHMGGDVVQDSDIQAALAGFHFLQPPKPLVSSKFGSLGLKLVILGVVIIAGLIFWAVQRRAPTDN